MEYDALYKQDGPDVKPPVGKSRTEIYHEMRDKSSSKSKLDKEMDLYETTDKSIGAIYDYLIKSLPNKDGLMFYEPAMGIGNIVSYFKSKGLNIVGTDKYSQESSVDFIEDTIPDCYDFIISI